MGNSFDEKIEILTNELEGTLAKMEKLRRDFVVAVAEFVRPWYLSTTEAKVKYETEITKGLGVEKLSQLKAELQALQESSATIAAEFLSDENLWWHKKRGDQGYAYYGNRAPDDLDKAVRLIAGKLAPILEKYGYLSVKSQTHDVWREWDKSGNYHLPGARPYFPYGLDWSDKMRAILEQYRILKEEGTTQASKIDGLKNAKAQSEAEDLWKQA